MEIDEAYRKSIESCMFDGTPCVLCQAQDVLFVSTEINYYLRQFLVIPRGDALFFSDDGQITNWYISIDVVTKPHHNRWRDMKIQTRQTILRETPTFKPISRSESCFFG